MCWGDAYLLIAEDRDATAAPRWVNLRICVADVDRVWSHVQHARLPISNPIGDRCYGLRDFSVRDPFGFEVRFAALLS